MDKTVLLFAGSAILVPLIIGVLLGQIPKEIFITWALPLTAATIGLLFAIRFIEGLSPPLRLGASIGFGLLWMVGGGYAVRRKFTTPEHPTAAEKIARMFGTMFLFFGVLWIAISLFQYHRAIG